jgi:diguanylate cyclase (GGDEF)-like protein
MLNGATVCRAMLSDISESRQAEEALTYLSTHDKLTGLYNRAFFEEEMARLERGREFPVSFVIADVDHLKITNDRDGHAAGDALLKRAAQVMTAAFRTEDVIARIGGDEFAVLLPNTSAAAAEITLNRVRHAIEQDNSLHIKPKLSLSLGASTAEIKDSFIEVLKLADANMYHDKRKNNATKH